MPAAGLRLLAAAGGRQVVIEATEGLADRLVDGSLTPERWTLDGAARALAVLEARLTAHLARFAGYHRRFAATLDHARTEPAWITGTDRDSCHRVWFELHEDLIATLGLTR